MKRRTTGPTPTQRAALRDRLAVLAAALAPGATAADPLATVRAHLAGAGDDLTWLALAVLGGRLPTAERVVATRRAAELDGPQVILDAGLAELVDEGGAARVEVLTDTVVVDIQHLARTSLGTGIQRVTRETLRRWIAAHPLTAVGWSSDELALRALTPAELDRALHGPIGASSPADADDTAGPPRVVVPWRATFVLPEVVLETRRNHRLQALFLHSRSRTAAIGFDTVPLTSAETCAVDVPPHFALELAALRHTDRIATISGAAATEYAGWRGMVRSAGLPGPEIAAINLPVEAPEPAADALTEASDRFCVTGVPLVLCVGSHEPRKNHLAVLHAAELLWREGVRFSLLFVGGNAWNSEGFSRRLADLQAAGRPVESVLGLSDRLLWALYRLSRCLVFPSVNEGFGLPVAEALAMGTPAVTSGFGSMLEIAADGGALTVDPRDDRDLADALRSVLTDDRVHARLAAEAAARPSRTWDRYAAETWDFLVATNVGRAAEPPDAVVGAVAGAR